MGLNADDGENNWEDDLDVTLAEDVEHIHSDEIYSEDNN